MEADRRQFVAGLGASTLAATALFGLVQGTGGVLNAIRYDGRLFRDRHFLLRRGEQVSLSGLKGVCLHNCRFTWLGLQPDQCLDLRESVDCTVIDCHFEGERLNFWVNKISA